MSKPVGFDQKILLHQLDYTAKQSRRHSKSDMYKMLDGILRDDITGEKSRKNVITILMKIWCNVPDDMVDVRDKVLCEFNDFNKEERMFAHLCMTIIAYPFFKDVMHEFGRLFQLQDTVASASIGSRMKESYGDRRRVEVATSAVISSLRAWELILPSNNRSYIENDKYTITNPLLHSLLFETILYVFDSKSMYVNMITSNPLYYPFEFEIDLYELKELENNFVIHYQGMDNLVVEKN